MIGDITASSRRFDNALVLKNRPKIHEVTLYSSDDTELSLRSGDKRRYVPPFSIATEYVGGLPGGCGRYKAACPGARCRRALHLGYGDDAVGDANAVTNFVS